MKRDKFVIYAHRGASAYAPENTKVAFEKAIELEANGIELDLQKTKDGKIVIFHDDYIDKKSNGSGKIEEYTYQELLELDFGSWFNDKYKNEKIVLFEDFARDYLDKDLTFAIELKVLGIEQETIKVINKYKTHNNIYITSFLYDALKNVRKIDSNIKLSWLIGDRIYGINLKNEVLHIVCGLNEIELWIITAYYPDNIKWEDDLKTRKTNYKKSIVFLKKIKKIFLIKMSILNKQIL